MAAKLFSSTRPEFSVSRRVDYDALEAWVQERDSRVSGRQLTELCRRRRYRQHSKVLHPISALFLFLVSSLACIQDGLYVARPA